MELRSSRSRSKTPFVVESFDRESIEKESSSKVVKMTRKTTTRSQINSSEVSSSTSKPRKSSRLEKSSKKISYKTSDYSSEDNDSFTSKRSITQNEKNQFIEDARALANGSGDISALELYRSSDRYWDKYPKTDYTYSYHSQDRFEIAPGEVIMPNMSRRTIHNLDCTINDVHSKSTNTDLLEGFTSLYKTENLQRRKLFNNNFDDTVDETTSRYTTEQTLWYRAKRRILTIISTITTIYYFFQKIQTSIFSKIHRFCSWVMLLDTYLMMKNPNWNKQNKLALLCIVPLLFFGGLHTLLASGVSLVPSCHPHCFDLAQEYFDKALKSFYNI
ncbi:unnamed protein product [Brassicogethes aeneus]|uniref:Uncharacterized protein n=1 Tax=Brassicogethes aeneus TaxID=1431903 RepID=A0A9P0BK21_BRAAE|nr:unnamed protein product [Brassicogethes aeneus]